MDISDATSRDRSVLDAVRQLDASFDDIPLDRHTIPQERLDLANRARTSLIPWRGQFSPELVGLLLSTFLGKSGLVVDPFVGSGTTLIESGLRRFSAYGADVNPAAVYAARTAELMNRRPAERSELFDRLHSQLRRLSRSDHGDARMLDLVRRVLSEASRAETTVLANCLMLAYGAEGKTTNVEALLAAFQRYESISLALPFSPEPLSAVEADARALPLQDGSASLVITSPPYVNVFNYHQHFRQAIEALGHKPLEAARSEIGANRKHRGNRFLTVIQYCLDMWSAFREMRRIIGTTGRALVVVGRESNVRGCRFENARALFGVAAHSGLALEARMERVFTSRYGTRVYEDILVMAASRAPDDADAAVRAVAQVQLEKAVPTAKGDVRNDIQEALRAAGDIVPSPLLLVSKVA